MDLNNFCGSLWRKKTVCTSTLLDTKLKRCLGLVDLVGIGLGSSLGLGVYVITSYAITYEAGPSFVLSVIMAGVASLFAGLCYAEFTARLPKIGSAYLYSYVTFGEMFGFVIGWNMILEHIISATLAAKAWSQYLDFMLNGTIQDFLTENTEWKGGGLFCDSPDLIAVAVLFVAACINIVGLKSASTINLTLVFFNLLIIMCFVCIGYFHVKHGNWTDPPGFFAHGFSGILRGAATLYFTFSNFEAITSCSEETREPTKNLPSAIMYTVFISFAVYFGVSTAATLSLHDFYMDDAVALPKVLQTLHIHGASSVIVTGGLLCLGASVIGACIYLPRLFYAMSCDRLLWKVFCVVRDTSQVPVYSILISTGISSVLALSIKFDVLLEIVSLGSLLANTTVSICVLCLRYQQGTVGLYMEYEDPNELDFVACTDFTYADFPLDASKHSCNGSTKKSFSSNMNGNSKMYHEKSRLTNGYNNQFAASVKRTYSFDDATRLVNREVNFDDVKSQRPRDSTYRRMDSVISSTSAGSVSGLFRIPSETVSEPTENTWHKSAIGLIIFIVTTLLLWVIVLYIQCIIPVNNWWILSIVLFFSVILISAAVLITKQPQNNSKLYFQTPYVPFVPLASVLINIALLVSLPDYCWLRFLIWTTLGLMIYFCYSRQHSLERHVDEQEVVLYEITDDSNTNTQ